MLHLIESSFFIQILFSHIKVKNKLKIAKYNNSLKLELNINLTTYKFFTGKYIIYEEKGKGKEYDGYNNYLLFEGEYLNGERNEMGKNIIMEMK